MKLSINKIQWLVSDNNPSNKAFVAKKPLNLKQGDISFQYSQNIPEMLPLIFNHPWIRVNVCARFEEFLSSCLWDTVYYIHINQMESTDVANMENKALRHKSDSWGNANTAVLRSQFRKDATL